MIDFIPRVDYYLTKNGARVGHYCPKCHTLRMWRTGKAGKKITYFCSVCEVRVVVQNGFAKVDDDPRKVDGCLSCHNKELGGFMEKEEMPVVAYLIENGHSLIWWEKLFLRRMELKMSRGSTLSEKEKERVHRIDTILKLRKKQAAEY